MKDETKVGLFVLSGLLFLATGIFLLGDFSFKSHYLFTVKFKDISGLADKSNIKLSGVEVGKVKEIYMDKDQVAVVLSVRRGVEIYRNSKFMIGSTSIIGSKFLQIDQGDPQSGTIKEGEIVYGENIISLDKAIINAVSDLQDFMKGLNNKGEFTKNLNEAVSNLREISADLSEMISVSKPSLEKAASNMDDITEKINSILTKTDALVAKIEKGEGPLGAMISDSASKNDIKQTISNIKETSDSIKKMMGKASRIKTYWHWDTRYEPLSQYNMNSFGVRIYTSESKYYYGGMSNFFNIKNKDRKVNYEEKNLVDAYMGWERKQADIYVGAIRGNAGAGIRYRLFYRDPLWGRFSVFAEGNDFSRNRIIKGRKFNTPRYDAGLDFKINSNAQVGVRIADMLETKRINYTAKILFEDKDLAYLFGLASGSSLALK
ncbi:MAG: MlaD family protein [Elusimicrobiota bacterium]